MQVTAIGAALLAGLAAAAAAETQTVLEALIAAENPCKGLRTEHFGMSVGLDRLKTVDLRTATIRLEGDRVTLDLDGSLACETGPGAAFPGDAAASVEAKAALSLADCAVDTLDVQLGDFGGSFGPLLAALAPTVEAELERTAEPKLREACREFRGHGT